MPFGWFSFGASRLATRASSFFHAGTASLMPRYGELTIAGYNGDYSEILTQDHGCHLIDKVKQDGVLLHDCDATFGSSGAPLLLMTPAGAEIIGLQSAIVDLNDGRSVGAAVPVEAFRAAAEGH